MPTHREVIRDDDDLLIVAVQELSVAIAPVVIELAAARTRFMVADEIERRDLVPRGSVTDQPTAAEMLREVLSGLEEHTLTPGATATGAHDRARRIAVAMGVFCAGSDPSGSAGLKVSVTSRSKVRNEDESSPSSLQPASNNRATTST